MAKAYTDVSVLVHDAHTLQVETNPVPASGTLLLTFTNSEGTRLTLADDPALLYALLTVALANVEEHLTEENE